MRAGSVCVVLCRCCELVIPCVHCVYTLCKKHPPRLPRPGLFLWALSQPLNTRSLNSEAQHQTRKHAHAHTHTWQDTAPGPGGMPPAATAAAPQLGGRAQSPGRAAATPLPRRRRPTAAEPPLRRRAAAPPPCRTWLEPRPRGGQCAEQPLERLLLNPGPLRNKATEARPASTLRRQLLLEEDAGGSVHRVDEQDVKEAGVDRRYYTGTRRSAATTPGAQIAPSAKWRRLLKIPKRSFPAFIFYGGSAMHLWSGS